jgi:small GTP-binding protein
MFGLLHNLYKYYRKKTERKITIALLGLDNAGKTTILNTLQGELDRDTTPTFGFNSSTLNEGKYKLEVFDLGGGKSIRSVWKRYLAEVHAVVYVVDAADASRFKEAQDAMTDVLGSQYMGSKPVLVLANKQDLPAAAPAASVVEGLGLATCRNVYNVFGCTAKTPAGQAADPRVREGLRWLVGSVDKVFAKLGPRVQAEGEAERQEEARKKKEREERLRKQREERLRQQKEEEERAREVERANELHEGPPLLVPPGVGPGPEPAQHGELGDAELLPVVSAHASGRPPLEEPLPPGLPNVVERCGWGGCPAVVALAGGCAGQWRALGLALCTCGTRECPRSWARGSARSVSACPPFPPAAPASSRRRRGAPCTWAAPTCARAPRTRRWATPAPRTPRTTRQPAARRTRRSRWVLARASRARVTSPRARAGWRRRARRRARVRG